MKRLACLVIVAASALSCAADDPNQPDTRVNVMMAPKLRCPNRPPPPPPKVLDDETVRAVLFPAQTVAREAMKQTGLARWLELRQSRAEWHRFWMNNQPSVLSYDRLNGAIGP